MATFAGYQAVVESPRLAGRHGYASPSHHHFCWQGATPSIPMEESAQHRLVPAAQQVSTGSAIVPKTNLGVCHGHFLLTNARMSCEPGNDCW
jgi:hypothetical protein